jgi:hypothetical protein
VQLAGTQPSGVRSFTVVAVVAAVVGVTADLLLGSFDRGEVEVDQTAAANVRMSRAPTTVHEPDPVFVTGDEATPAPGGRPERMRSNHEASCDRPP